MAGLDIFQFYQFPMGDAAIHFKTGAIEHVNGFIFMREIVVIYMLNDHSPLYWTNLIAQWDPTNQRFIMVNEFKIRLPLSAVIKNAQFCQQFKTIACKSFMGYEFWDYKTIRNVLASTIIACLATHLTQLYFQNK